MRQTRAAGLSEFDSPMADIAEIACEYSDFSEHCFTGRAEHILIKSIEAIAARAAKGNASKRQQEIA